MHPHRAKAKAMMAAKLKGYATGGRVGSSDISEPKVKLVKGEEGKGYAAGGMVMGMKAKHKAHMKKPGTHINIINMPHGGAGAPPMGPPPMPGPGVGMIPPPVRPVAPAPMPGPMGMPPPGAGPMMRKNGGRVAAFKKGGRVKKADGGEVDSVARAANATQAASGIAKGYRDAQQRDSAHAAANTVAGNMRRAVNKIDDVDTQRAKVGAAMSKPLDDESSADIDSNFKKRGGKVAHKATGGRVSRPTATAKPYGGPDKVSKSDPLCKPDSGKFKAGAGTGEGREEKVSAYGKNAGKAAKSSSTS